MRFNDPTAQELTKSLSGQWTGRSGIAKCPAHEDKEPSLSISDGTERLVMNCHAGCTFTDIRTALVNIGLMQGKPDPNFKPRTREACAKDEARAAQRAAWMQSKAKEIWQASEPLENTVGARYLAETRGREIAGIENLRFHPDLMVKDESRSAGLVARIQHAITGQGQGLHRTFLDASTLRKTGRKMFGPAKDGAARLFETNQDPTRLAITEGIEDALAVRDLGMWSGRLWACLTANGIRYLPIVPDVEHLTIYADGDTAGIEAARACAQRWADNGVRVLIEYPKQYKDFDDLARAVA